MTGKLPEVDPSPLMPESSFRYNPLAHVRVLFIQFVQGLFAASPRGSYHWSPDDSTTELYVSGEAELNPTVVERMPGVNFVRGPIQFYGLGLDDMHQYNFATDAKTKGVLLPGTMSINVCSSTPLESEHIAWVISDHIWVLRHLLLQKGFFEVGRSIVVGSPSPAGAIIANDRGSEFTCTRVDVPYQFPRLSQYTPLNMDVVQAIQQILKLVPATSVNSQGALAQGHNPPYNVELHRPPGISPNARDVSPPLTQWQPHPLNPSKMVCVRVIRPNNAGSRMPSSPAAIPISQSCVEQLGERATTPLQQKG